jgi:hypothetical protein
MKISEMQNLRLDRKYLLHNSTSATNPCTCKPGYYVENSRCNRCPVLASSCATPFKNLLTNLICKTNATKAIDNLSCKCKDGFFFWDNDFKACPGMLCKTCEYGVCTDCISSNSGVVDGVCKCYSGLKYSSANNGSCVACEALCTSCAHDSCLSCKSNASLDGINVCICDAGYYFDSSDSTRNGM